MPKIEEWLNETVADSTNYIPMELVYDKPRLDLFYKFLEKEAD